MAYIISDHRFREHESFFQAQGELARLHALHPGRDFQIYKVRRVPEGPSRNVTKGDEGTA